MDRLPLLLGVVIVGLLAAGVVTVVLDADPGPDDAAPDDPGPVADEPAMPGATPPASPTPEQTPTPTPTLTPAPTPTPTPAPTTGPASPASPATPEPAEPTERDLPNVAAAPGAGQQGPTVDGAALPETGGATPIVPGLVAVGMATGIVALLARRARPAPAARARRES